MVVNTMNVVITGANRGLGLGFVRHYLAQGCEVWACYRNDPGELLNIDKAQLHVVRWDVSAEHSESDVIKLGMPDQIDLLINNAGIYGPKTGGGQDLLGVSAQAMKDVFDINCIGPVRVVQRLLSRLEHGRGVIANISSKMGSSSDNGSGGCYAYRAAKAALVIVSKSMAIDLAPKEIGVITLHPGWVRTDMTNNSGLISVEESVAGMTKVIASYSDYELGQFVAFDGKVIPF